MELSGLGFSSFGSFGGFGTAPSGGTSWLDVLNTGIGALGNVIASRQRTSSSSFVPMLPSLPSLGGIVASGGLLGSLLPGGPPSGVMTSSTPGVFAGGPLDAFRPDFYRAGAQSYRARKLIPVQSPSGELSYWRHVGRPVAFSGDQGHCRRLAKVARKLGGGARCGSTKRRRR